MLFSQMSRVVGVFTGTCLYRFGTSRDRGRSVNVHPDSVPFSYDSYIIVTVHNVGYLPAFDIAS